MAKKKPARAKSAKKAKGATKPARSKRASSVRAARPSASAKKRSAKSKPKISARRVQRAKPELIQSANLGREYFQGKVELEDGSPIDPRGIGADAAGQSGDLQGLSEVEDVESESVEELVEEGQDYEAEVVAGVERAGDTPDAGVPSRERKDEFEPETEEEEVSRPARRGRPRSR